MEPAARPVDDPVAVVAALRAEWGLDFRRVEAVLRRLAAGRPATLTGLVEESGLPRRGVERVLAALRPWLQPGGDAFRLAAPVADLLPPPAAVDTAALEERMAGFATGLPASRWRLDHVPATPATMAGRAEWLHHTYDLTGASVVCLGDHDLTSVALALVEPGADLAAVDVDEPILDHLDALARAESLPLTAAFADLRLGLPPSLAGTADLVFTDPPYTPDGIRLFLERGVEALRPSDHARLVFCYGHGDRHLVRGVEVQQAVADLRLVLEAVLPGFNRYRGAEAIGSRSSLYVCRPTTRTWKRRPGGTGGSPASRRDPRIYTRGPAAEEAPPAEGPFPLDEPGAARVGPGGDVPLGEFVHRTVRWATSPTRQPPPFGPSLAVDLHPHFGGSLLRLLLLAAAERIVLRAPSADVRASGLADPDDPIARLAGTVYDVSFPDAGDGGGEAGAAVVAAARHGREPATEAARVLAHLVEHPGAKAGNAWREGLRAWARRTGGELTKNDARRRIAAAGPSPSWTRLRIWELPRSSLRELVEAVERTAVG